MRILGKLQWLVTLLKIVRKQIYVVWEIIPIKSVMTEVGTGSRLVADEP